MDTYFAFGLYMLYASVFVCLESLVVCFSCIVYDIHLAERVHEQKNGQIINPLVLHLYSELSTGIDGNMLSIYFALFNVWLTFSCLHPFRSNSLDFQLSLDS